VVELVIQKRSICPISQALDLVGDKWTLLIVRDIGVFGKHSFTDISASPERIPPATLTGRLELLIREDILLKECISGGPGRQYRYTLTKKGEDLIPVLTAMQDWSNIHNG
jgi:DNA-binding HxlR family transcriptional regulator